MMVTVPSDDHGMPRITGLLSPTAPTPATECPDNALPRIASEFSIVESAVNIAKTLIG
jgi:hypothetical protein